MTLDDWLPKSVQCLKDYNGRKFVADVVAGITVGLVALPLAMAFAIAGMFADKETLIEDVDCIDTSYPGFAEQLALRWDRGSKVPSVELSIRHWSNAGIRLPNRGQDFAVLSLVF